MDGVTGTSTAHCQMAGNYLGTGIGIVLVLLGRCILDREPEVSGRGTNPGSVFYRVERNKAVVFYLCATNTSE